jgi:uncharacterized membrane protein
MCNLSSRAPEAYYMSKWLPRLQLRDCLACAVVLVCFTLEYWVRLLEDWRTVWEVLYASSILVPALGVCLLVGAAVAWAMRGQRLWIRATAATVTASLLTPVLITQVVVGRAPSLNLSTVPIWITAVALALICWRISSAERGLWGIVGAAAAFSLGMTIRNYVTNADHHDMTVFVQAFVSTLHHGRFFYSAMEGGTHFGHHNSPILFLLLPVYALGRGYGLLAVQSLAVASSAIPLAMILARKGIERTPTNLFCSGYLFLPMIMGPTLRGFHELPLALPLLLWALYFFEEKRAGPFYLFAGLSLLVRENLPFVIAMFAPYAYFRRRSWHWVVLPAIIAAFWAWFSFVVVFGTYAPQGIFRTVAGSNHAWLGSGPKDAVNYLLQDPKQVMSHLLLPMNRMYLGQLLGWFGSIIPLGGLHSILAIPDVAIVCLASGAGPPVRRLDWHYHVIATSMLTVACASVLQGLTSRCRLSRTVMVFAALVFCILSFGAAFDWVPPLTRVEVSAEQRQARALVSARIPASASVALPPGLLLALSDPHWNAVRATKNRCMGRSPVEWVVTHPTDRWIGSDPVSPEHLQDAGYAPVAWVLPYTIWRRLGGSVTDSLTPGNEGEAQSSEVGPRISDRGL